MMLRVDFLLAAPRIARSLTTLLYRPQTVESARAMIRARMADRDLQFLRMVRETIWPFHRSPYRRLLDWSGWSLDRLEASVTQRGLDATLRGLLDEGVYMSFEELKGRRPIERPGLLLEHEASDVNNPTLRASYEVQTGGTRSEAARVPGTLEYLMAQRAPSQFLMLEALSVSGQPTILWHTRDASMVWWLSLAHSRRPPLRWFSLTDLSAFRVPQAHRMMFALARLIGRTRGLRLPHLEHVPLEGAPIVLEAVLAARERHGACVVVTTASAAARLAALSQRGGRSLTGVTMSVGAEPLTPGKYEEIVRAGARASVRYAMTELGCIGFACGDPAAIDEMHFMADSLGLVCDRRALPDGTEVDALYMTTLLTSSPKIYINVETDDFAHVTQRRCGCLWDDLGLTMHLDTIRSFSKFKAGGTMVLATDCLRILEEVLPREFGGQSTDYQLLEVEDEHYQTRLWLVVSPSVGPVDAGQLRARFLEELRKPNPGRPLHIPLWHQADTLTVVRREPVVTPAGKLMPIHTLATSRGPADRGPAGREVPR